MTVRAPEAAAGSAARPRARSDRRARVSALRRRARAWPQSRDTSPRTPRSPRDAARCPPGGAPRRSSRASNRLRSNASLVRAPQRFERGPELADRAEDAVLRRARAEAERAADFVDGSSLVMPQREGGALERAQRRHRVRHAPLDFGALAEPLGIGPIRPQVFVQTLSARLVVPGL